MSREVVISMTTIKKYRLFINPFEEEKWINDQLERGYKLVKLTTPGIYTFIESDSDYVVKIDCQIFYNFKKYNEYIALYEDFGWELVGGKRYGSSNKYWIKRKGGNDSLFSDAESKLTYYQKNKNIIASILVMLLIYFLTFFETNTPLNNVIILLVLCMLLYIYINAYINIKKLEKKLLILERVSIMNEKLGLSILKIIAFVIIGFVILWFFDTLNLSTNDSGLLNFLNQISWIQMFSNSVLNAMFSLILFIAVVRIVILLIKSLKSNE